jgi:CRISPR/Cas system-associated exonuclease Cas4 (RecB family)
LSAFPKVEQIFFTHRMQFAEREPRNQPQKDWNMKRKHRLDKYDYLQYLACPEALWLAKNNPPLTKAPPTAEELHNMEQGNLIDRLARELFSHSDFQRQRDIRPSQVFFQVEAEADGLVTRCDILVKKDNGNHALYEVKAASNVKSEHLHDIAFQVMVFGEAGYSIEDTFLVHVNNAYVRKEKIELTALFVIAQTTDKVFAILQKTKADAEAALAFVNGEEPKSESRHLCGQNQHCPFFKHTLPAFPAESFFDIANIRRQRMRELLGQGIFEIKDIPDDFFDSVNQKRVVEVVKRREPHIDKERIREFLSSLRYPLCFLDYEGFGYALPVQVNIRPYQQMVYQYSLHVQHEPDGELRHFAYLLKSKEEPVLNLVKHLKEVMPDQPGHVVVWNQYYERDRNIELAKLFPAYETFFGSLNERLFDLMEIFKKHWYLHPHSKGKYSIKTLLPVLVPQLRYDKLSIDNGLLSNIRWHQYTENKIGPAEKEQVWNDLLEYCRLDTLAMVEILKSIRQIAYAGT